MPTDRRGVKMLKMKVIRVKWRNRNDTDTGRIRWKGLGNDDHEGLVGQFMHYLYV